MTKPTPRISVILCTYNRPDYLADAVASVTAQDVADWELLVVNDGGLDVGHVVSRFEDPRIRYFDRKENRGKAACCNFALEKARGEYIAYIDDDDQWYPHHLRVLSELLDKNPDLGGAYSDLYSATYAIDKASGRRYPLHKEVFISRNFNRRFMFNFNQAMHVCLMHRKEAALRVGGYDETVRVLIDWDIARKLAFVYDLEHLPMVTGEYMQSVRKEAGREEEYSRSITGVKHITDRERESRKNFVTNIRRIKSDLPPGPWPKVRRVLAVYPVIEWDDSLQKHLERVIDRLDYPARLVLVDNGSGQTEDRRREALGDLAEPGMIEILDSDRRLSLKEAYYLAAKTHPSDFMLLMTGRYQPQAVDWRVISGLDRLDGRGAEAVRWEVKAEEKSGFDVLVRTGAFLKHCETGSPLKKTTVRGGRYPVVPTFRSDREFNELLARYRAGDYEGVYRAATALGELEEDGGICRMVYFQLFFDSCRRLGREDEAEKGCRENIEKGYEADNWVRLGLILQSQGRFEEAAEAFRNGLDRIGLKRSDLQSPAFPFKMPYELDSFSALIGLGECLMEMGDMPAAEQTFHDAIGLWPLSHRSFLGLGRLYLAQGRLDEAEAVLSKMGGLDGKDNPDVHRTLGELCERRKRYDLAFSCYLQAFEHTPKEEKNLPPIYRIGSLIGEWVQVKRVLDEFLSHNPHHREARSRLRLVRRRLKETGAGDETDIQPETVPVRKPGRNAPCPCGSGKKYKKCCLNKPAPIEDRPLPAGDPAIV